MSRPLWRKRPAAPDGGAVVPAEAEAAAVGLPSAVVIKVADGAVVKGIVVLAALLALGPIVEVELCRGSLLLEVWYSGQAVFVGLHWVMVMVLVIVEVVVVVPSVVVAEATAPAASTARRLETRILADVDGLSMRCDATVDGGVEQSRVKKRSRGLDKDLLLDVTRVCWRQGSDGCEAR